MIRFGIVSEAKPGYCRVHLDEDDIVSAWLPIVVTGSMKDKFCPSMEVGEQVACLMDEHCENGVVLGAIFSRQDTPPAGAGDGIFMIRFDDGTVLEYDRQAHRLKAVVQGTVRIEATGNIEAESDASISAKAASLAIIEAPDILLKGTVTVDGTVTATEVTAAGISLTLHKHGGVQSGGSLTTPAVP